MDSGFNVSKKESACKPGFVENDHSSGIAVTGDLKRPTRKHAGLTLPLAWLLSYLALLQVGFAMPPSVTTGAVRSYRTVSPLPASLLKLRRFALCCTFRRLTPPRGYLAPCPREPGLSSPFREKCSDRPADSARTIAACQRALKLLVHDSGTHCGVFANSSARA